MENLHRKLLQHNGKTIILHDYRKLEGEAYVKAVEYNGREGKHIELPQRLIMIDVTDSIVDKAVMKAFKQVSQNASSTISKTAVVGVSGIQKLFISTVATFSKLNIRSFNTQDEAKKWLTSSK
jgi:hypothetical protein